MKLASSNPGAVQGHVTTLARKAWRLRQARAAGFASLAQTSKLLISGKAANRAPAGSLAQAFNLA